MKTYLTVRQICERLPVCKTLVYRLVSDGTITSTRLGGKILVPEEDLAALLESRRKAGGDGAMEVAPKCRRRRSTPPPDGIQFRFL